jgi:hypothetical protein
MPELDYMVLADGVTPRPDGKIDIYGAGFDTIFAPSVPTRHAQMAIVVRILLSRHEGESDHTLRLVLMSADGPELARAEAHVQQVPAEALEALPAGDVIGLGVILNLAGVIFPAYGRYHLALLWDGNELREPLRLKVAELPQGALPGLPGGPPVGS